MEYNDEATRQLESIYLSSEAKARRSTLLNTLCPGIDDDVIDIGTGPGFIAYELANRVGRSGSVTGVDNSESSLRLAAARCQQLAQVNFKFASATDLPYTSNSFDCAISVQVFEYIENVNDAIAEMFRVLKPGGKAALIATDWDSIIWNSSDSSLMQKVLKAWEDHCAHTNLPRTLLPRLRKAGFELVSTSPLHQFATADSPEAYVHYVVPFIKTFVTDRHGLTECDTERWAQDLEACSQRGEYFFCLNQFMVIAQKPPH